MTTDRRDIQRGYRGFLSGGDTRSNHGDPDLHTITGAWGSELMLLEFRSGQLNSSRTSCNSQPPMTLHLFDSSDGRCESLFANCGLTAGAASREQDQPISPYSAGLGWQLSRGGYAAR
jgi:hypothetical protein